MPSCFGVMLLMWVALFGGDAVVAASPHSKSNKVVLFSNNREPQLPIDLASLCLGNTVVQVPS